VSRIIIRESQSDQIRLTPDATFLTGFQRGRCDKKALRAEGPACDSLG